MGRLQKKQQAKKNRAETRNAFQIKEKSITRKTAKVEKPKKDLTKRSSRKKESIEKKK